ncbi:MAG: pyrimidine reductase family protein [Micrococcales bacterium]|nr:pyrimidine reductase family protein [Micrococcales bacterium]
MLPAVETGVSDARLLEVYGRPPGVWLRANFVASLDGAATSEGLSAGLQPPGDGRVFELLRRLADVVLVGAGTVASEGYTALRVDDASVAWRRERGMPEHPVFAIASRRLDLDPGSPIFADAPVRPIVVTTGESAEDRRGRLAAVADVLVAGEAEFDAQRMRAGLAERGLTQILCEGGPSFFGSLIEAGVLDELCLTVAPRLLSGGAQRIAHASAARPTPMHLEHVLREGDALFLCYRRER